MLERDIDLANTRIFVGCSKTAVGLREITGLYTAVYSKTSNLVHADPASVERFMTMPLPGEATIHASESADYPSFALAMVGFLLIVFEHHFNWPSREVIDLLRWTNPATQQLSEYKRCPLTGTA